MGFIHKHTEKEKRKKIQNHLKVRIIADFDV